MRRCSICGFVVKGLGPVVCPGCKTRNPWWQNATPHKEAEADV